MRSFLIIGGQRSGTSLLTRILNQHSSIAVPPESFFFNTFLPLLKYYGDLGDDRNLFRFIDNVLATPKIAEWSTKPTREQVLSRLGARTAGAVFTALLESWAENQGKSVWGEKTPHHVFYWPEIETYLPGIPVVHIVRDGRDVALGLVKAKFGPKSVYAAAVRWKRWMLAVDRIRNSIGPNRFLQISYEELLLSPEKEISRICEFLELEFEPGMLDFHRDQSVYSGYAEDHANLNKPLLTDKVAAWRRNMKPADVEIFDSICEEQLRQYDYPVDGHPQPVSSTRHLYYRWIDHPPRKAAAMFRNRQGHNEEFRLLAMRVRLFGRYISGV